VGLEGPGADEEGRAGQRRLKVGVRVRGHAVERARLLYGAAAARPRAAVAPHAEERQRRLGPVARDDEGAVGDRTDGLVVAERARADAELGEMEDVE
jgi:hypothetical protein